MNDAEKRHLEKIKATQDKLNKMKRGTPIYKDTARHLNRLQKELKEYRQWNGK